MTSLTDLYPLRMTGCQIMPKVAIFQRKKVPPDYHPIYALGRYLHIQPGILRVKPKPGQTKIWIYSDQSLAGANFHIRYCASFRL